MIQDWHIKKQTYQLPKNYRIAEDCSAFCNVQTSRTPIFSERIGKIIT